MASRELRGFVIAAVAGILGTVAGAVSNGLMNAHVQQEERRLRGVLESFRFDQGNYPVEFIQVKQFLDTMRDLSVVSAASARKMAAVARQHPNCLNSLSEACEALYIEGVRVMREEAGSGSVSADDLKALLHEKYVAAGKAVEHIRSQSR